ncbi:MAG: sugar kinase [Deltaproteobacteria bacterium]|nr:sugar kinase [Deltaproteobacteria bacterium]MBW2018635.1 sugar kinase [Deltaproteobacteria bacterium]MBW2073901.1 sugar kinase [Deltaproteobacteria bacterium]RLB81856.1 MAG: sugar kinase [Deltaproteobacteria bacterium]
MLALIGTVPKEDFPLVSGTAVLKGGSLSLNGYQISVNRGTPALIAATSMVCETLGLPRPFSFLVGDIGLGDGSRKLYRHLKSHLPSLGARIIAFHYLQPDVDWHNRILWALEEQGNLPVLIADAGYMYAAKMSGFAASYDLFTPDIGELAFLADEVAPHPFYTRGFILHEEDNVPGLIKRAFEGGNAAKTLLIKGSKDYICTKERVLATVDTPRVETLEPIGGTGDTLTGMVAALTYGGYPVAEAAILAARANRLAGALANPTPATQVVDIVERIPKALEAVLDEAGKVREQIFPTTCCRELPYKRALIDTYAKGSC